LSQPRDAAKLRADVVAMRQRMHDGHPNRSQLFDLKHDSGGIVDVEFMVQYLVLTNAAKHAQLTANAGNLALLGMAARLGLIDSQKANVVAEAYRDYRRLQHAKRLQGESMVRVPLPDVQTQVDAVRDLWSILFNAR